VNASRTNHTEDEAAILALEEEYDSAWNHGDAKVLASFVTHDAIVVNPHGQVAFGMAGFEKVMSSLLSGQFKGSTHRSEIIRIHFVKQDVAVVDGEATVTETKEHEESTVTIVRFSDVMVKEGDRWFIADTRAYILLPDTQD
jgi:uncharacterized protein (TIGR02246 family)